MRRPLPKTPTGIHGLDEVTFGGLPRGRTTLVCGGAGCGKTQLATEFLVHGALDYDEPGVFVSFEESVADLTENARSLGFDLDRLAARKMLIVDTVRLDRSELAETGAYDLEGLFLRLGHAIDAIGAKRVVLDTVEVLFAALTNQFIVRAELVRLFRWLKAKGVTAIVTGERGNEQLTRHGLEEYVSDCVILLDQRPDGQTTTRLLRVVKYRGSPHDSNEIPFLIDEHGFSVSPITALGLTYEAPTTVISSGVPGLDAMLHRKGYFRGASVLLSGTAGTGKSSMAAALVHGASAQGERCLYMAFEESADQIVRNMRSIGMDLAPWIGKGLLHIHASRPTARGLEAHLLWMHRLIEEVRPRIVAIDPVSNLTDVGDGDQVKGMLARLIDVMKVRKILSLFTSLTPAIEAAESTRIGVSSLMDVWMLLRNQESNGERNRTLQIVKARGMKHSNQVREFVMSKDGIHFLDVERNAEGRVAVGAMRKAKEQRRTGRRRSP